MPDEAEQDHRPFVLDEQGVIDRDSCLFYAEALLEMYTHVRNRIIVDSDHYDAASQKLEEIYNYAQDRYKLIQKNIFVKGQDNYFFILSHFPQYVRGAFMEVGRKYGTSGWDGSERLIRRSEWRGPMVVGFSFMMLIYILAACLLSFVIIKILKHSVAAFRRPGFRKRLPCMALLLGFVIFAVTVMVASFYVKNNFFLEASNLLLIFAWLVIAILVSMLIRLSGDELPPTTALYTPLILLGFLVISFRIIFIPNKLVNLVFPPLLVAFFFWQSFLCRRNKARVRRADRIYGLITLVVMGVTAVISIAGYVLLGVQLFIWWLFQLAFIQTVTAMFDLLDMYRSKVINRRLEESGVSLKSANAGRNGEYIQITWLFDLVENAVVPVVAILSLPISIWMAASVFDLTEVCKNIFFHPFVNLVDTKGNPILHLSLYKLTLVSTLFFVFRYVQYFVKSVYRKEKIERVKKESGQDYVHANQVNLTLAYNLIGICVWGFYAILSIHLLKIPMGAISVIAAGLAAVGFIIVFVQLLVSYYGKSNSSYDSYKDALDSYSDVLDLLK